MKAILIHAWSVQKKGNNYFLPYTHWVYLNEIVKYYDKVCLLSPTIINNKADNEGFVSLKSFQNVVLEELPPINSYINAIKYFFKYCSKYKKTRHYYAVYARYPVPFGWLQKLYLKNAKRIIHFVGDPIDAAKTNPNFNWLKKRILITFFMPEHYLYLWACKGAKVYTNGFHLAERLRKQGVNAKPLISSTLNKNDFYFDKNKVINNIAPKIIYVGYLRKAKGVETVINAFFLLLHNFPKAELSIVGSGDFEEELKQIVQNKNIRNITFLGHIDQREKLNDLLRTHDIFCFASLSEGSPRVILEAMANGLNVISTPVGALPNIFTENEHIFYAGFNNPEIFREKLEELIFNPNIAQIIRTKAYSKVQNFTIQKFLKTIFNE